MNILVLNGSPRPNGNTAAMVEAFVGGASENGHNITVVPVCQKRSQDALPVSIVTPKARGNAYRKTICRRFTLS